MGEHPRFVAAEPAVALTADHESSRGLQARMRRVVTRLSRSEGLDPAAMTRIGRGRRDPYAILVGTVISLRTRDEVTIASTGRLLAIAPDVKHLDRLPVRRIERTIFPAGFYRTKARSLKKIARILIRDHEGRVPSTMEELLDLPGVGRKTANLVLLLGHGIPGICVDTHVHRISNRLGFVATRTPEETEMALRESLPAPLWWSYNELLVGFGKSICTPLSPRCSICDVARDCRRVGVTRRR